MLAGALRTKWPDCLREPLQKPGAHLIPHSTHASVQGTQCSGISNFLVCVACALQNEIIFCKCSVGLAICAGAGTSCWIPNALAHSARLAANGVALARQEVICCSSVQQQRRTSASSCGPQAAPRSRRRRRGHQQSGMEGEVSSSALHMHRPLSQAHNGSMTTQLNACCCPKYCLGWCLGGWMQQTLLWLKMSRYVARHPIDSSTSALAVQISASSERTLAWRARVSQSDCKDLGGTLCHKGDG